MSTIADELVQTNKRMNNHVQDDLTVHEWYQQILVRNRVIEQQQQYAQLSAVIDSWPRDIMPLGLRLNLYDELPNHSSLMQASSEPSQHCTTVTTGSSSNQDEQLPASAWTTDIQPVVTTRRARPRSTYRRYCSHIMKTDGSCKNIYMYEYK